MQRLKNFYIYYTWQCNLHCKHCWVNGGNNCTEKLDPKTAYQASCEAIDLGAAFIKLSGGEPLLHASDIVEIANMVKLYNPDISLCLETNATLINEGLAKQLQVFDSISVSVDSSNPEEHDDNRGRAGAFNSAINGIELLRKNNIKIGITTLLQEEVSYESIDRLISLSKELGVHRVKLNPIMNVGRAYDENSSFYSISPLDLLKIKSRYMHENQIKVDILLPCAFSYSFMNPESSNFISCDCLSLLSILPDKTIGLCGEASNLTKLQFGRYGVDSIKAIWNDSPSLIHLRDTIPSKLTGICGKCVLKSQCMGGCRVEGLLSGGEINSPSYICQYMFDRGLFPYSCR